MIRNDKEPLHSTSVGTVWVVGVGGSVRLYQMRERESGDSQGRTTLEMWGAGKEKDRL